MEGMVQSAYEVSSKLWSVVIPERQKGLTVMKFIDNDHLQGLDEDSATNKNFKSLAHGCSFKIHNRAERYGIYPTRVVEMMNAQ